MESQYIVNTRTPLTPRPFMFTGKVGDYYRIYLSNMLLSILTLGIYSAWAKVRNRRFFYGNTTLMGHAFDYDARPVAILIARLIFLPLFLLISFGSIAGPVGETVASIVLLVWILLLPVFIIRSRAFNARYTVHRSVRFHYRKVYWPYYRILILSFVATIVLTIILIGIEVGSKHSLIAAAYDFVWELVVPLVVTLLLAYLNRVYHRIQINQLGFGNLAFRYTAPIGSYIKIMMFTVLFFLLLIMITILSLSVAYPFISEPYFLETNSYKHTGFIVFWGAIIGSFIFCFQIYKSMVTPVFWSAIVSSDGSKLTSTIRPLHYLVTILLPNLVLSIITLGGVHPMGPGA